MKHILLGVLSGVVLSGLAVVAVLYFADLRVTHEPVGSAPDEGSGLAALLVKRHEQQPIDFTTGTVDVPGVVGMPLSRAESAIAAPRLRPHVVGLGGRLVVRENRHARVARQEPPGGSVVPGGHTVRLYVKSK